MLEAEIVESHQHPGVPLHNVVTLFIGQRLYRARPAITPSRLQLVHDLVKFGVVERNALVSCGSGRRAILVDVGGGCLVRLANLNRQIGKRRHNGNSANEFPIVTRVGLVVAWSFPTVSG